MRVISIDRHAQRELLSHGLTPAANCALCWEQNVGGLLGTPHAAAAPALGRWLHSQAPALWPAAGQGSHLLPYPKISHLSHYRETSPHPTTSRVGAADLLCHLPVTPRNRLRQMSPAGTLRAHGCCAQPVCTGSHSNAASPQAAQAPCPHPAFNLPAGTRFAMPDICLTSHLGFCMPAL